MTWRSTSIACWRVRTEPRGRLAGGTGPPRSPVTVGSLLDDGEASFERLHEFAAEIRTTGIADPRWESVRTPLRDLRVLARVQPSGHVFQSGANYRQHV